MLLQDLKHAIRIHAKSVGFTSLAVLTLGLGIGASTTVFSVVDAILLKPLPYPGAGRIVLPWRVWPIQAFLGYDEYPWGRRDFRRMLTDTKSFESLGLFQGASFNLTGAGEPLHAAGIRATSGFFKALGVSAAIGRTFIPEEDLPGHQHEAVLSDTLWRERFGADPAVVGRAVALNGEPYTVVGVMPASFAFPHSEEMPGSLNFPHDVRLWTPLPVPPAPPAEPDESAVVARLKPGVTLRQAQADMDNFAKIEDRLYPAGKGWFGSRLRFLSRQVSGETQRPLLLILGAVGVVLLIACANVASLLLTRSLTRRREFTLRAALGASRRRLVGQLLTESLLLAIAGGVLGIFLSGWGIAFTRTFGPSTIPRLREAALNYSVLGFALLTTLLTGILFGLAPTFGAIREDIASGLKEGGQRAGGSHTSSRLRNALLVSEVALALVLVVAAGLLVRTFRSLLAVDAGFNAEHVLSFELSLPETKYNDHDRILQLYQRTLQRLREIPGVQAAGIGETVPMSGAGEATGIRIPGRPPTQSNQAPFAGYTMVSAGYFEAVGTPILRGRGIRENDTADSMPVAVISATMAKKFWPGEDPIGKQVGPGSTRYPAATIVGIAADVKHVSMREDPGPEMYVPFNQKVWPSLLTMQTAVRTRGDPAAVIAGIRTAVRSVDPELPVAKLTTLSNLVDNAMTAPRFSMLLLSCFGMLAVVLAAIGMYGVISYSVTQRTRELGVRMALGAGQRSIFGMVLGQGGKLAALGIAIGFLVSLAVTRLMAGLL